MSIATTFMLTGNPANRAPMARYLKDQFSFVGTKSPDRKCQSASVIRQSKDLSLPDLMAVIEELYQRPEREYQYVAIDMAVTNVRRLSLYQLQQLTRYVTQKSWWDSVDSWRKVFGDYVQYFPDQKQPVFQLFSEHPNFWMRRVAILLQLTEKQTLDRTMLVQAIEYDLTTDEFFIQKAIGWALRNYSKVDPVWVAGFLATHREMSSLAIREASKYL